MRSLIGLNHDSGKYVQRAFRGHLLVDQCITHQLVAKIIEHEPGFENVLK